VNALIAAAPAQIARHFFDDLIVVRRSILIQKCGSLHDLSRLTKAALRHAQSAPRLLNGMLAIFTQSFKMVERLKQSRKFLVVFASRLASIFPDTSSPPLCGGLRVGCRSHRR
jgi:hypothetical protein